MAAAFDVASSKNGGNSNVTQLVWAHTVTAGLTNVVLLVVYSGRGTVSSVDYNGHALTNVAVVTNTANCEMWKLIDVPIDSIGSAKNITVNVSSARCSAGAASFSGADVGGTPLGVVATTTTVTSGASSLAPASAVGDVVFGGLTLNNNSTSPTNGQTSDWSQNTGGTGGSGSAGEHTAGAAGTTTLSWSGLGTSSAAACGIAVKKTSGTQFTQSLTSATAAMGGSIVRGRLIGAATVASVAGIAKRLLRSLTAS